ncbi:hypothetical protein D3C75_1194280 [compost metagenome]
MRYFAPAQRPATDSTAPMVAAIAPSSMNGSWMNRFDAPTIRMIPVSRRRLIADSRMVVVMSSTAASSITPARPRDSSVALFSTRNRVL